MPTSLRYITATSKLSLLGLLTFVMAGCGLSLDPSIESQDSGTDQLLIGISPVSESVVWISGTGGTFGRTLDGGATWQTGIVEGADSLQFRDVHGVDAHTAYLLSIGPGDESRIYKTVDGGENWELQFTNPEPQGFFDCFDFWDADSGMAFSDSFDGSFFIIITEDGGSTWTRVAPDRLPVAREGEGSFAASGLCLEAGGDGTAWIGTGASREGNGRVLRTPDRGRSWSWSDTPIAGGSVSGLTSVTFIDSRRGAALGGDVMDMESLEDNVSVTTDGGHTWTVATRTPFAGPVYGAVYVPAAPQPTLVAAGPMGLAFSADNGDSWIALSDENHWSVGFASPGAGWAIGTEGRITRIALYR
ncbi:MAG: hypothetical protein OXM02_05600 [Bacteroidota bacterium]|nr:hypothetical protein [Bacteroidota bacterium]